MAIEVPAATPEPVSKSDVLDLLNAETDETEPITSEEEPKLDIPDDEPLSEDKDDDEDTEEESDDEEEELKDFDFKDEDEDKLQLSRMPKRAELKAAYPDIFKKFPALDNIVGREKAFSEQFATVADAKEAKDRLGQFQEIEGELLGGSITGILKAVKGTDEKAYNKIIGNYFKTLNEVDPAAHLKLSNDILKGALKYISNTVAKPENESEQQLAIAVKLLNKAIYGSYEVTGPDAQQEEREDPKEKEFQEKTARFEATRFRSAYTDVVGAVNTKLTTIVTRDIDPKGTIPEYVKTKLVGDVLTALDKQLNSDTRFKSLVDRLWLDAKKSDYNDEAKSKLRKALINKALTVLPGIAKAKRAEAMRGLTVSSKSSSKKSEDDEPRTKRESGTPSNNKKVTSSSKEDYSRKPKPGESAISFMMRD